MKHIIQSLLCAALCGAATFAHSATVVVQVRNYFFTPTNVTINVGDSIRWTNTTGVPTANTHDSTSTNGVWNSGDIGSHSNFTFTFTSAGTYPYLCFQHYFAAFGAHKEMTGNVFVVSAAAPPFVSITNPATGSKFPAPATVSLQADASDTDGSVTNVEFFSDNTSLGSDSAAPYALTVNNAAAGNYSFTARAADNSGLLSTSTVVNVSVLTNATLTAITPLSAGQFQLTISGIANQTYATESSTNLQNWSSFATNVAPANIFNVTDSAPADLLRFYRARQDF